MIQDCSILKKKIQKIKFEKEKERKWEMCFRFQATARMYFNAHHKSKRKESKSIKRKQAGIEFKMFREKLIFRVQGRALLTWRESFSSFLCYLHIL